MKRATATRRVVGREAQIDLCPSDGGMVVSFGRLSFWVEHAEAEDLVETIERALLLWSRRETANDALAQGQGQGDDEAPVRRRAGAAS